MGISKFFVDVFREIGCFLGFHEYGPWVRHIEQSERLTAIPMQFELCFCERCSAVLGRMRR